MSETLDRLRPELERLTEDERADLACFPLSSLDGGATEAAATRESLERRSAELRTCEAVGVPAEDLLERLRMKYP